MTVAKPNADWIPIGEVLYQEPSSIDEVAYADFKAWSASLPKPNGRKVHEELSRVVLVHVLRSLVLDYKPLVGQCLPVEVFTMRRN